MMNIKITNKNDNYWTNSNCKFAPKSTKYLIRIEMSPSHPSNKLLVPNGVWFKCHLSGSSPYCATKSRQPPGRNRMSIVGSQNSKNS